MASVDKVNIEGVEFAHIRDCDVCHDERSRPEFNMHDPRTRTDYFLCSAACVKALDMTLKVERALGGNAKPIYNDEYQEMYNQARAKYVASRGARLPPLVQP